jgi:hypothetical protein
MKRYWKPKKSDYWTRRSKKLGRRERVFDDDEAFILMKAAIEREGSSLAFAERCGVDRTYISHVLRGRHPLGAPIIKGLGLRRVYVAAKKNRE